MKCLPHKLITYVAFTQRGGGQFLTGGQNKDIKTLTLNNLSFIYNKLDVSGYLQLVSFYYDFKTLKGTVVSTFYY